MGGMNHNQGMMMRQKNNIPMQQKGKIIDKDDMPMHQKGKIIDKDDMPMHQHDMTRQDGTAKPAGGDD